MSPRAVVIAGIIVVLWATGGFATTAALTFLIGLAMGYAYAKADLSEAVHRAAVKMAESMAAEMVRERTRQQRPKPKRQPKKIAPHWQVLGLMPLATEEEVNAAYHALAMKHHPDRGGSAERMREINLARDAARAELKARAA